MVEMTISSCCVVVFFVVLQFFLAESVATVRRTVLVASHFSSHARDSTLCNKKTTTKISGRDAEGSHFHCCAKKTKGEKNELRHWERNKRLLSKESKLQ